MATSSTRITLPARPPPALRSTDRRAPALPSGATGSAMGFWATALWAMPCVVVIASPILPRVAGKGDRPKGGGRGVASRLATAPYGPPPPPRPPPPPALRAAPPPRATRGGG